MYPLEITSRRGRINVRAPILVLVLAACSSKTEAPAGKLELVEAPAAQDVSPLIVQELQRAEHDHKRLLVYVGAAWCEPCTKFHEAAAAGALDAAFGNLRLLAFDEDRDNAALARAGFKYELIPLFAIPTRDGRSTGKQIEGSIKGESAVEQISPRLRALLDQNP